MQLEKVLAQAGIERITAELGEAFDPTYRESVELRYGEADQPIVAAVIQSGSLHENELLRPAGMVVVKPIDYIEVKRYSYGFQGLL